ncbi:MAG: hypothetical protein ACTSO7_00900 [Candidatus Heimdallarchaeota archaeon]
MTNFIEKNYRLIAIIGSVLVGAIIIGGVTLGVLNDFWKNPGQETPEGAKPITVNLFVNFNGFHSNINTTIYFTENQTANGYTILLNANLTVTIDQYANGVYIRGIEGISQNINHYWWYQVDDIDGHVAADRFNLRDVNASVVTWIYRSY